MVGDGGEYQADYDGEIKGKFPLYLFNLKREGGERGRGAEAARLAVSVKGGHVAWMLRERMVPARELSLEEAAEKAREFLRKREYPEMVPISIEEFRNAAIISLARKSGETIIQPETIKVQVALDNGEILGMEAIPYLTFRDPERKLPSPRLTPAEARKKLHPRLRVEGVKRVVILNDRFQETLCYECDAYLDNERFLIYINALTGEEENIKRVDRRGVELDKPQPYQFLKPGRAFFFFVESLYL